MPKRTWMGLAAAIALVVAGVVIWKTTTAPVETVGKLSDVPAKGAGRFDTGK